MDVKAQGSTLEQHSRLSCLNSVEVGGIPSVEVKFVEIGKNILAKAANWTDIDAEARKRGEQTGLDTLVVHAVNDAC